MENKVFLNELIRYETGLHAGKIDWRSNIGKDIKCIYNNSIYIVCILNYEEHKRQILTVCWDDRVEYVHTGHFCDCKLGKLFKQITSEFRVEIGSVFNDKNGKRNITIMNREMRGEKPKKYYQYHCNVCGYENYIDEYALLSRGRGCACCASKVIIYGVNDLITKKPNLEKYIVDVDNARTLAPTSGKKIKIKCPDCKEERYIKVRDLYKNGFSCPVCSDSITIPEKFIISTFRQLKIKFKTQYSPKWANSRRYDFYIPNFNCIVEVHGAQHYEETTRGRSLAYEQSNDVLKQKIALKNGISKYIVIDCRHSNLEWLKNNTIDSELNQLMNLEIVDFDKSFEFAMSSNIKVEVKNMWNNKDKNTTSTTIANKIGIDRNTVTRYLKFWASINLCDYDVSSESQKGRSKSGRMNGRAVEVFKDNVSYGVFYSASELERQSENIFGIKFDDGLIGKVAKGKKTDIKGYIFKYV